MIQNFDEYVLCWWHEFIGTHPDELKRLMQTFIGEEETITDYLEEGETPYDWLSAKDNANEIYTHFFGWEAEHRYFDDLPDTTGFVLGMFKQACTDQYDYVDELLEDMAEHVVGYDTPYGFFHDLSYGGCSSGMIGMFIYNDDCKRFYIDHIDDMEAFVEEFEGELGEPIRNKGHLPHYTFICWVCYEELAYSIGRTLYPENF